MKPAFLPVNVEVQLLCAPDFLANDLRVADCLNTTYFGIAFRYGKRIVHLMIIKIP